MLLSAFVLGVFAIELPEVKWITPEGYSWGKVDTTSAVSLPLEVEFDPFGFSTPVFLEYRIDGHGTSAPWTQVSAQASRKARADKAPLIFKATAVPTGASLSPGVHYVEARVSNGEVQGPSSSSFFNIGNAQPTGLFDIPKKADPIIAKILSKLSVESTFEPLGRVEYSVGDSGVWQHAGDFGKEEATLDLPIDVPRSLGSGDEIPIRFRAFNGLSWTPVADQPIVMGVMNVQPTIARTDGSQGQLSVVPGRDVALPVSIEDADKDRVHVLAVFNNGAKVAATTPAGDSEVILPAAAFEGQLTVGVHTMEVYAFDGLQLSAKSVRIDYAVSENAEDNSASGPVSDVGIVGIAVGAVALVAIVAVVVIFRYKAKKEESSTSLIESQ
jgi:hypothetical protein